MSVNAQNISGNTVPAASPEQQLAQLRLDLMHEVRAVQNSVQAQNTAVLAEVHQLLQQHAAAPPVSVAVVPSGLQQSTIPSVAPAVSYAAKMNPPEPYTGARTQNIDEFCFEIKRYVEYNGLPQASPQAVQCASSYLRGLAAQWWRLYCERNAFPVSVCDFCELLRRHFRAPNAEAHARDRLTALVQQDGRDSLRRYNDSFMRTATDLPDLSAHDLVYFYIRGLHPRLKGELRARNPQTLDEALALADTLDQSFRDAYKPSGRHNSWSQQQWQPQPPQPPDPNGPTPMQLGSLQLQTTPIGQKAPQQQQQQKPPHKQTQRGDGNYTPRCQLCRKLGHYANQCPLLPPGVQLPTPQKTESKNGQRRH